MYNQNTQALPKVKFTWTNFHFINFLQKFLFYQFSSKIFILPSTAPKHYIVLNVKDNNKERNKEKSNPTWYHEESFNMPNKPTPLIPSKSSPTTKSKSQVNNHTLRHKHILIKKKNKKKGLKITWKDWVASQ